ncbi:M15 family metallopeptidase [Geodermatophilus sabuli]|uniref:M15 family metallopeptidase n=1 Tax=Geodermatophilus sabuli TaxID=1564158 RepID=A0A7K3VXE1_9ACTN|nr:M15 family metallopeptidase [Geodermatophilus sabuli]NEK56743.1 M15 family metallopeptidase [Geodermatophilus sabuli]
MSSSEQVRTTARRARSTIAVVLALAVAAVIGLALGYQAVATPVLSAASPGGAPHGDGRAADAPGPGDRARPAPGLPPPPPDGTGWAVTDGVTVDDGVVPDGVTVFDGRFPAVADLDPDLLSAVREAATAAAHDGVEFSVTSGWRSPAYQEHLLREAVAEYGSAEEAARWVATAETSAHVTGDAVDIGPADATAWLSEHGAEYGLCQVYGNEPWHYELRPGAAEDGCPAPYADPTHDPRLQQ